MDNDKNFMEIYNNYIESKNKLKKALGNLADDIKFLQQDHEIVQLRKIIELLSDTYNKLTLKRKGGGQRIEMIVGGKYSSDYNLIDDNDKLLNRITNPRLIECVKKGKHLKNPNKFYEILKEVTGEIHDFDIKGLTIMKIDVDNGQFWRICQENGNEWPEVFNPKYWFRV